METVSNTIEQAGPVRITNTHTTMLACLQKLDQQTMAQHGDKCVAAAEAVDDAL